MSPGDGRKASRDRGDAGLDPADAPDRWERTVASVVRAAEPELRRRAARPAVAGLIGRWARPLMASAAAVIAAASLALLRPPGGDAEPSDRLRPPATTELGGADAAAGLRTTVYPRPMDAWLAGYDARPTVEEIVFSPSPTRDRPPSTGRARP